MNVLIARTPGEIDLACERFYGADAIGCDTETSSLNSKYGGLLSMQFSDGELHVLVPLSEGIALGRFKDLLSETSIIKVFHNAKFDLGFLSAIGVSVHNVFDTMLAEKVLTHGARQSASLADTLYRYFAVDLEKSHRTKFNRSWDGVWTKELVEYALSDVAHLPALMREQQSWMEKLGLVDEYQKQVRKFLVSSC